MKRFALLVVLLMALATPVFAINGVGDIGIFADDQGNSCEIAALGSPAPFNIYIVHKFLPGEESTGSRFKVSFPAGIIFFAFSANPSMVPGGTLTSDQTIGYGSCVTANTSLGFALVQAPSAVTECSYVSVLGSDFTGLVQATNCSFEEFIAGAGQGIVNPNDGCRCNIATHQSTWGKVKSLYR
jgi:opacity protein-like surface antigen